MIILSLFDGISCWRVALERAGIPVKKYFASEVDKYAMQIANKDLDFWCKIKLKTGETDTITWKAIWPWITCLFFRQIRLDNIEEIIGHPIMIGNVLDYFWNKKWLMTLDRILRFWEEKTKTIEEQSDKCIDYIYNLISK